MSTLNYLIEELKFNGITDKQVLDAIAAVPREKFVPSDLKNRAYDNTALPIDCQQTISQPYIVALMSQALMVHPHPQKILEIGTGSGYQAAVLARLVPQVWTIERIEKLYDEAKQRLTVAGYHNIQFKLGDGAQGWQEASPFDGIIVTAAASHLPPKLIEQLSPQGGIMVIPLGQNHRVQQLTLVKKQGTRIQTEVLEAVTFVPLIENPM